MRHKKSGRKLNRSNTHRRALSRNLVASFLGQFGEDKEYILTTPAKAKEFRSFSEKLITLGKKAHQALQEAASKAEMSSEEVQQAWRASRRENRELKRQEKARKKGQQVEPKSLAEDGDVEALKGRFKGLDAETRQEVEDRLNKVIHFRRLAAQRLQDEAMVKKLFDEIAPAYMDRPGGYTRVLKTSILRLGDGTFKAMLAFTPHEA